MGIQNKLTFQFDNQASFKLDGNTIDLGKMATDQVVLGKDGKEKTIKGSFVMAKMAGTESIANMMSENSITISARNRGVA